ncbi:MAG: R3H domain protein [Parcubacteria group bacterium GW2011_GWC1_45_14]|nr:MAG: R3H domain protein [Parcubacteria group bacterium GW2011_GWC1_45_14]
MNEQNKVIKNTLEELLSKMGFDSTVEIDDSSEEEQDGIICNILTKDDSNFLIGQYGVNLQAVQHIARLLVRKRTAEKTKFIIDVNSYRKQKNESIVELAKEAAQQAVAEKRAVVMKPMSNYERRIVHLELSKDERITTESIGEGEGRKIVVKPADSI